MKRCNNHSAVIRIKKQPLKPEKILNRVNIQTHVWKRHFLVKLGNVLVLIVLSLHAKFSA